MRKTHRERESGTEGRVGTCRAVWSVCTDDTTPNPKHRIGQAERKKISLTESSTARSTDDDRAHRLNRRQNKQRNQHKSKNNGEEETPQQSSLKNPQPRKRGSQNSPCLFFHLFLWGASPGTRKFSQHAQDHNKRARCPRLLATNQRAELSFFFLLLCPLLALVPSTSRPGEARHVFVVENPDTRADQKEHWSATAGSLRESGKTRRQTKNHLKENEWKEEESYFEDIPRLIHRVNLRSFLLEVRRGLYFLGCFRSHLEQPRNLFLSATFQANQQRGDEQTKRESPFRNNTRKRGRRETKQKRRRRPKMAMAQSRSCRESGWRGRTVKGKKLRKKTTEKKTLRPTKRRRKRKRKQPGREGMLEKVNRKEATGGFLNLFLFLSVPQHNTERPLPRVRVDSSGLLGTARCRSFLSFFVCLPRVFFYRSMRQPAKPTHGQRANYPPLFSPSWP